MDKVVQTGEQVVSTTEKRVLLFLRRSVSKWRFLYNDNMNVFSKNILITDLAID